MVEKGAVDDADFLFGVHLRPIETIFETSHLFAMERQDF